MKLRMGQLELWLVAAMFFPSLVACSKKKSSGGPEDRCVETGCFLCRQSVSQHGITWDFDGAYPVGQFANGDYWVVGPVSITSITPEVSANSIDGGEGICDGFSAGNNACQQFCADNAPEGHSSYCTSENICLCGYARNGWEVNPMVEGGQGFDSRATIFDGRLIPSLPYQAAPGQSLVKSTSLDPDEAECRPCLSAASVLTVVDQVPADCGSGLFRPPYVGDEKPLYPITDLQVDLLPTLASVDETPTLQEIAERFGPVQLDHKTGFACRRLHPEEHMPDYGCDIGRDIGDGILRLMLSETAEDKMPALVAMIQMVIDGYHMALLGKSWSVGCDGHDTGRKLAFAFGAVLLDHDGIREVARDTQLFEEDLGVYFSDAAGLPLYGYVGSDWSEERYWVRLVNEGGSRSHRDPYQMIDGGEGTSNYQGIVSPTWKGEALALHLMPELRTVWENPIFENYVDRWVNLGYWFQPDPCAPHDGNWDSYGVSYGPDGNGSCIPDGNPVDGTGRFPDLHATEADGPNRRSAFQGHLWDAYRGPSCYDGICESGETAQDCPYDCPL